MFSRRTPLRLLPLCLWALTLAPDAGAQEPTPAASPAPAAAAPVDPSVAAPKTGSSKFFQNHEAFLARGKEAPIGVLFLGDSITEGWKKAPEIWAKYYWPWHPANFGISGDRTEHVLWRIEQGELDGLRPKVLVLMIGTNNTGSNSAEEIAAADRKIIQEIRTRLPETKVLVLGIFPRGPRKGSDRQPEDWAERMQKIRQVNADLAKLDDGKTIRFLDIGARFMEGDRIPGDIMPDQLHPNAKGYGLWAEAMQPLLSEMMK